MDLKGRTALVTGASNGLGVDFSRQLAARGVNLVITARREERLQALAEELSAAHGVTARVIAADLGAPDAAQALFEKTEGAGTAIDILINNAGFGTQARFIEADWQRVSEQLQLNIVSLTELTWRFGRVMAARGAGWILNVASIGAYIPCPDYATYTAGKSYVRNFSEAVAYELADSGVRVCCLNPGPTATEFMETAGHHELAAWERSFVMQSDRCARIGLDALFGGRRNVVAGWLNKVMMGSLRVVPRRAMVAIGAATMGKRK